MALMKKLQLFSGVVNKRSHLASKTRTNTRKWTKVMTSFINKCKFMVIFIMNGNYIFDDLPLRNV